jgi:hypothetical protein
MNDPRTPQEARDRAARVEALWRAYDGILQDLRITRTAEEKLQLSQALANIGKQLGLE